MFEFALPDVGEGLTEAEVLTWCVAVGDTVAVNDPLVEIETAKSVVELPSPAAGVIEVLHVEPGETVPVGTPLVSIGDATDVPAGSETAPEPDAAESTSVDEKPKVLVGPGPVAPSPRRRHLRARAPVRASARQLGVDMNTLDLDPGSVVTRDDVAVAADGAAQRIPGSPHPPSSVTRIPIKGVRRATAAAMVTSAFTAPHVTEWLTVDVTRSVNLLAGLKRDKEWSDVRITPLALVARALLFAVRRFPEINAQWDEHAQEIVVHHDVNLGIAAATPRGLLVPNIKNAQSMDLRALAGALQLLVERARAGKTPPDDMAMGTITITNIGALGVDAGTPILNPGEAAILAFGSIREMPWVVDGHVVPRHLTQLAMSFDHRLVDGELGSRVLVEVGRLLSDPGETFLYA